VRDAFACHFTGKFSSSVRAHAIGDHEQVTASMPVLIIACHGDCQAILVVAAPQAHVGRGRVLKRASTLASGFGHIAHCRLLRSEGVLIRQGCDFCPKSPF
jgi:hypothetical protein